jgi:hypothetical protein
MGGTGLGLGEGKISSLLIFSRDVKVSEILADEKISAIF